MFEKYFSISLPTKILKIRDIDEKKFLWFFSHDFFFAIIFLEFLNIPNIFFMIYDFFIWFLLNAFSNYNFINYFFWNFFLYSKEEILNNLTSSVCNTFVEKIVIRLL